MEVLYVALLQTFSFSNLVNLTDSTCIMPPDPLMICCPCKLSIQGLCHPVNVVKGKLHFITVYFTSISLNGYTDTVHT